MTNFDTFLSTPQFSSFAPVAVSAERILPIDPSACVLNCRRAMEFAVKWMYSVDKALVMPYQDTLVSLMNTEDFRDIVGADIWRRMDLIRRMGNNAAHTGKKITQEQAALCLENLYVFLDFVAYCYGENYTEGHFDPALLTQESEASAAPVQEAPEVELAALMAENAALKEELTARRAEQQQTYVPKPLDLSEYKTRKLYIDTMLTDAGWTEGKDWLNEVELPGMPNKSEVGYADYVLYGDDGRPLAVVEAKRTCVDVAKGRQQAKLYADLLEKKYHRRPVIFLTNGFETRITDNIYPERKCAAIYSKRDLEKLFNLQTMRTSLKNVMVDQKIAGRYYQEGAIKAACDAFARNRRKALLVMATGSGKTRTVIALCDVLLQHGWVTNLCEEKDNYTAHCVFSTYQTMYNVIDSVQDEEGKLFTCGHFDLVICDEAHRSVYNKYRDIFNYFDAPLVGLTATPKDEIDKNTYEIFELENGVPTYGYELAQAVKDGYLVDFLSVETKLKFMEQGIVYDDLSDADKRAYEDTFEDENGELPDSIASSALNEWIFNEDTIRQVLNTLMTHGLTIDYGNKLGKTIIFAKNHTHAEMILSVFNQE
ncbi:MAG: DEAD/DEAH box helicase family protein [Firmicutes bacterium]|nr:DEAD/DEAH box helicase family protein [Bacillota bacterium]